MSHRAYLKGVLLWLLHARYRSINDQIRVCSASGFLHPGGTRRIAVSRYGGTGAVAGCMQRGDKLNSLSSGPCFLFPKPAVAARAC